MISTYEKQHYCQQRLVIGILIFLLPIVPILMTFLNPSNPPQCRYSISDTYFTNARVLFIGVACICGFFMLTYRPYGAILDTIANWMSGIGLIGMVIVPTIPLWNYPDTTNLFMIDPMKTRWVHYSFAVLIFVGFLINLIWCFQKSSSEITEKKKIRNKIYSTVAWIYAVAIVVLVFYTIGIGPLWLILVAEYIAIIPTAFAWLVKAEVFPFLNDK